MPKPHSSPPNPPPPAGNLSIHLVSDLDGTWIPAADRLDGLRRLEAFLEGEPGIILTFATGRGLGSALALLEDRVGRMPDHLVTDVGTALHHRMPGGAWAEDLAYAHWVEARWPAGLWERLAQAGLPAAVRPQPGVAPCRRLALEREGGGSLAAAAEQLRAVLDRLGVQADVLASQPRYLDVLPPGVDKGAAVRHMALALPLVACGDSENDLGLWRIADLPILMADSPLAPGRVDPPWPRLVRPRAPGPEGILEVLVDLAKHGLP